MARFKDVFSDETKRGRKIQTSEYLSAGNYPVIDQGQAQIAGYTNLEDGLFIDVPAIVFGDHTRIIKYIDRPFFLGADGVKVLKAKVDGIDYKYLFYCLQNARIPNTGYNRHFKWLKEVEIPLPPLEEQRRIAATLDKVSDLIAKRRAQLDKLDLLVKARFVEMFGDPNLTNQIWDMSILGNEFSVTSGGTPSTTEPTYWEKGTIPWIGSNMCQDTILYGNDGKFITKSGLEHSSAKVFPSGTVLVALVGATIGKTALLRFNTATNQNVAAIDVLSNKRFYPEFIFYELQMLYEKFQELGSGKFKMANQGFVRGLPTICPPLELQKEFAVLVELIQKSKLTIQQSLDKLETLKSALMQQYFGG